MAARHREGSRFISATPSQVFAFLDDHSRLSSHMETSSWMMGGGRMSIETDDAKGQAVGSHIRMGGHVFGLRVFLDEVVTRSKGGSELRVFIDYDLPSGPIAWLLGRLCADWYAKWCVDQTLAAPAEAFATNLVAA